MISANPNIIDTFVEDTPNYLREAIYYCATPYWFQEPLAIKIIEKFVHSDYSAQDTFYQLVDLPFIYSHDDNTWQYTDEARNKLIASLVKEGNKLDFRAVHSFVADEIKSQLETLLENGYSDLPMEDQQTSYDSWQVRRLRWQLIYYLAPVDPNQAYNEFETIAKWALQKNDRLPMYKLAVDAWERQSRWLNTYKEEGAYYLGYFAYKTNDLARAENLFGIVWLGSTKDTLMKADAGHLLGVIYRQKGQSKWIKEAEEILRESLRLVENEDRENKEVLKLIARILNSLGATLIQTSSFVDQTQAQKKLEEARLLLQKGLKIQQDVLSDDYGSTYILNTLATLYLKFDGDAYVYQAKEFIERSLELLPEGYEQDEMIHLNTKAEVLIKYGGKSDLDEAERILLKCLEINRKWRDKRTEAISSNKLAKVYYERGDSTSLQSALEYLRRSLKRWEELNNLIAQKECMEFFAEILDKLGYPDLASDWRRKSYQIIS